MSSDLSLTIYGCRGSYPVAGPQHQRYGGATSCVVVRAGSRTIILDAGSGIANYGREAVAAHLKEGASLDMHLFFTHLHLDHLMGLSFFAPMYMPSATIQLWGPRMGAYPSFEAAIATLFHPPFFPVPLHEMQSVKRFYDINESHSVYFLRGEAQPVQVLRQHPSARRPKPEDVEVEVQCMRGFNHPKCGVLLYKVIYEGRSIVYATDTEGYVHGDKRLTDFAQQAEVLIHDAMYTADRYTSMPSPTQGYGHSTVEIAARVATHAKVKRLILFHHDPMSTDEDLDAFGVLGRTCFPHTEVARDGMTLDL